MVVLVAEGASDAEEEVGEGAEDEAVRDPRPFRDRMYEIQPEAGGQ